MTYYVALAFKKAADEGGDILLATRERRGARNKRAASLAATEGHCEPSRSTGDSALGDFEDALILKAIGEVDIGLLSV
jgi:hypothetical protein